MAHQRKLKLIAHGSVFKSRSIEVWKIRKVLHDMLNEINSGLTLEDMNTLDTCEMVEYYRDIVLTRFGDQL